MSNTNITKFSQPATHQLITGNEFMVGLGLGTCTTGILYSYFCARNNNGTGDYINRGIIRDDQNSEITHLGKLFGTQLQSEEFWGYWWGWRYQGENYGKHTFQKHDSWNMNETLADGQQINLVLTGGMDKFQPKQGEEYGHADQSIIPNNVGGIFARSIEPVPQPLDLYDGAHASLNNQQDDLYFLYGGGHNPILQIIAMNDFIIEADNLIEYNKYKYLANRTEMIALYEYVNDIRSSKNASVRFYTDLTFNAVLAGGRFVCPQTQRVEWDLILNDEKPDLISTPMVSVPAQNLLAEFGSDETGRNSISTEDGKTVPADKGVISQKIAAKQKLHYNEYLNEFESGTTQMMAIVVSGSLNTASGKVGIRAAQSVPTVDSLIDGDIELALNSDSPDLKFIPSTGVCYPITMQNRNPLQWSPKYASDEPCRDPNDFRKQEIIAYNFNPQRQYEKGDVVYLNQVGGIWHITDPGISPVDEQLVPVSIGKNWSFQQFATNSEFFFRRPGSTGKNTPESYEKQFHLKYYYNIEGEGGKNYQRQYNEQFSTAGIARTELGSCAACQLSSFDMMDSLIFGTRGQNGHAEDLNALAQTIAEIDPVGQPVDYSFFNRNAAHTGPFFGCTFPQGYSVVDTVNSEDTPHHVRASVPDGMGFVGQGLTKFFHSNTHGDNENYVKNGLGPFFDIGLVDGGYLRSDARLAYHPKDPSNPIPPAADSDYPADWVRVNPIPAYSMFESYNQGYDVTLRHLPADIATLGHQDSEWGGPIYNINRVLPLYYDYNPVQSFGRPFEFLRTELFYIMNSFTWLSKEKLADDESDVEYSKYDDVFGFRPNNPGSLQFRPLKAEVYAALHPGLSLEKQPYDVKNVFVRKPSQNTTQLKYPFSTSNFPDQATPWDEVGGKPAIPDRGNWIPTNDNLNGGTAGTEQSRVSWSAAAGKTTLSMSNIWDAEHIRERHNALAKSNNNVDSRIFNDKWISAASIAPDGTMLDEDRKHAVGLRFLYSDYINKEMWINVSKAPITDHWAQRFGERSDFRWMFGADNYSQNSDLKKGVSAYGVITAQTTVAANNGITFQTNTTIGMRPMFFARIINNWTSNFLFDGFNVATNTSGGVANINKWTSVWGNVGEDSFSSPNTTNLAVTAWQHWPRADTLYDSLHFATHHFNSKVEFEGSLFGITAAEYYDRYGEYASSTEWPDEYKRLDNLIVPTPNNPDLPNTPVVVTVALDPTATSTTEGIGVREPSIMKASNGSPIPIDAGSSCWSDKVDNISDPHVMLAPDKWHLNTSRIGKLLPYNYIFYYFVLPLNPRMTIPENERITIPLSPSSSILGNGDLQVTYQLPEFFEDNPKSVSQYKDTLLVFDNGIDYEPGDLIGNRTCGAIYEVTKVGPNGEVIEFKINSYGAVPSANLAAEHDDILEGPSLGVSISSIQSVGRAFSACFVNIQVESAESTDHKPLYLMREQTISAPNNQPRDPTPQENHGFLNNEGRTTSLTIDDTNRSEDRQYDLFFFFHNDINFTWLSSTSSLGPNAYFYESDTAQQSTEQFINLEITAN